MAVKYIPFYPEPIEGQAILNNFRRTLRYKGANDINAHLLRGMLLYEVQETEQVGSDSGNMVIRGECVSTCAYLKEQGISVDLVYIVRPSPVVLIMPRKFICAAIPRWPSLSRRPKRRWTARSCAPLKRRCTATFGIRKNI